MAVLLSMVWDERLKKGYQIDYVNYPDLRLSP